jgi:hypothetical protein
LQPSAGRLQLAKGLASRVGKATRGVQRKVFAEGIPRHASLAKLQTAGRHAVQSSLGQWAVAARVTSERRIEVGDRFAAASGMGAKLASQQSKLASARQVAKARSVENLQCFTAPIELQQGIDTRRAGLCTQCSVGILGCILVEHAERAAGVAFAVQALQGTTQKLRLGQ